MAQEIFEHKLKGAIMYRGGTVVDFSKITAKELFNICFKNNILLDVRLTELSQEYFNDWYLRR